MSAFSVNIRCVFHNPTYVVLCINEQMTTYTSFTNGAHRYTLNLASATWVLYSLIGDLVSPGGTCLGPSTKNLIEYHTVIGLLTEALDNDVREIRVYFDLESVVHQLNRVYAIWNPLILRTFRRVGILEKSLEKVSYQHTLRYLNIVTDSLAKFFLDWYHAHS